MAVFRHFPCAHNFCTEAPAKALRFAKNICILPVMDAIEIIAAFGGRKEMARITGAQPDAVTQWRRIGVPSRYWHVLVAHAKSAGIKGITFDVLAATKPSSEAA